MSRNLKHLVFWKTKLILKLSEHKQNWKISKPLSQNWKKVSNCAIELEKQRNSSTFLDAWASLGLAMSERYHLVQFLKYIEVFQFLTVNLTISIIFLLLLYVNHFVSLILWNIFVSLIFWIIFWNTFIKIFLWNHFGVSFCVSFVWNIFVSLILWNILWVQFCGSFLWVSFCLSF